MPTSYSLVMPGGAMLDEPRLGGGAAHVEGEDVVETEDPAEAGGGDDPRRGTRLDHEHGLGAGGFEGQDAAAALHDQQLPLKARIPQPDPDVGEIPLDDGPHAGVDQGWCWPGSTPGTPAPPSEERETTASGKTSCTISRVRRSCAGSR